MTIREKMISLLTDKDDEVANYDAIAFSFSNLMVNTTMVTCLLARGIMQESCPNVTFMGERYIAEAKERPSFEDFMNVFNGNDLMRYGKLAVHIYEFIKYMLDQEEPEDDDTMWYDFDFLGFKWNEFVDVKMGG